MANWKYGVSFAEESPMTSPLPLAGDIYENLRKAAAFGYDGLELHTRETAKLNVKKIKEVGDECGCHICRVVTGRMYTQGGLSLLPEDDNALKLQQAFDAFSRYFEYAQAFQVGTVVGWSRGNIAPGEDHADGMKKLGERMEKLNEMGKAAGVPIAVEVINHYEMNTLTTVKETKEFLEQYELDGCWLHLDTYHMGLEENDPCEAIRIAGKRIGYFHTADSTRRYPGSGQFNFPAIMKALYETGYNQNVVVECLPDPDRDTAAKKAIDYLKDIEPGK